MNDFIFVTRPNGTEIVVRASAIAFFLTYRKEPCLTEIWFSGKPDDFVLCKEDSVEVLKQLQATNPMHGGHRAQ